MYSTIKRLPGTVPTPDVNYLTIFPDLSGVWYQKDENGDITPFISPNYEELSHSELLSKISGATLVPDKLYLINDYATIYTMPGTSPAVEVTSPGELLVVKAIADNKISNIAYSPQYPNDIIVYEPQVVVGLRNATSNSRGIITYRIDTLLSNSYPGDFRNIKVRRWDDGGGDYIFISENGNASTDIDVFGLNARNNTFSILNSDALQSLSILDDLPNTYITANSSDNYFSSLSYGLTFQDAIANNKFNHFTQNTVFKGTCVSVNFQQPVINTIFNNLVINLDVNPDDAGNGLDGISFQRVKNCKFRTMLTSSFNGDLTNCEFDYITNSTFSAEMVNCKVQTITNSSFYNMYNVFGLYMDSVTGQDEWNNIRFLNIGKLSTQDMDDVVFQNYVNTTEQTLTFNFERNIFLGDIVNSSFIGGDVTDNTFEKRVDNTTFTGKFRNNIFNGKIIDSLIETQGVTGFINNTFLGEVDSFNLTTLNDFKDNYFNSKVTNVTISISSFSECNVTGIFKSSTIENINNVTALNVTGGISGLTINSFVGNVNGLYSSANLTNVIINKEISNVNFVGGATNFTLESGSSELNNVTFQTFTKDLTITTGSANLANVDVFSCVVHDSNTLNWYERRFDSTVGSGSYVSTAIS